MCSCSASLKYPVWATVQSCIFCIPHESLRGARNAVSGLSFLVLCVPSAREPVTGQLSDQQCEGLMYILHLDIAADLGCPRFFLQQGNN